MDEHARPEAGWGRRVKRLRRERGWSQRDLAREAAVGQAQLSRIESGSQDDANISTAVRLAEALDTSLDALIGRQPAALDPRIRELARLVLGLDGAGDGSHGHQQPTEQGPSRLATPIRDSKNLKGAAWLISLLAPAPAMAPLVAD